MGAVTWSLATGEDAEDFEIDKSSGELSFMKSPRLRDGYGRRKQRYASNAYSVTVIATDADGITTKRRLSR